MHIESISGDAENRTASQGISRRSVMKVGAAAAWSVPLVQVVAAAPAHATSGPAQLDFQSATGSYTSRTQGANTYRTLDVTLVLENKGGTATQAVTVTLTLASEAWVFNNQSQEPQLQPNQGWTRIATLTYQFVGGAVPAGGMLPVTVKFDEAKANAGVPVSGNVKAVAGSLSTQDVPVSVTAR
jgi:hypothetical protein